jgi:hypothetical protein
MIGRRRDEQIGILPIPQKIARTRIGAAVAGALRLRHRIGGLRIRDGGGSQESARGRCRQHVTTGDGIHGVTLFGKAAIAAACSLATPLRGTHRDLGSWQSEHLRVIALIS